MTCKNSLLIEHYWSNITFGTEWTIEQIPKGTRGVFLKAKCTLFNKMSKWLIDAKSASFISDATADLWRNRETLL